MNFKVLGKQIEANEYDHDHERMMIHYRFMSEIEKLMDENGYSKKKLGELIGTSSSYITQLFRGNKIVNLDLLAKIQNVFGIKFDIDTKDYILKERNWGFNINQAYGSASVSDALKILHGGKFNSDDLKTVEILDDRYEQVC